jgi:hypothetical protein
MQETNISHQKSTNLHVRNWTRRSHALLSIRGLNLEAIRPTTVQVTAVSELRHNLRQKSALTGVLCIFFINVIHCSKVTKRVWCP